MKTASSRAISWQTAIIAAVLLLTSLVAAAQTAETTQAMPASQSTYQPKFPGDPARSDSEANALGYMRTVIRAQKQFNKKNDRFATSLMELVHTGSFTRRMAATERGDYSVGFKSHKDGYDLTLTPKELSADRRSFFANEDGIIHVEEDKAANEKSPKIK